MGNPIKVNVAVNAIITIVEHGLPKILLVQHARPENKKGLWGLPGGKVELDESFEEAMAREIYEEVGIDKDTYESRFIKILHDIPNTTCKHIFAVNLFSKVDLKIDQKEIMNTAWIVSAKDLEKLEFRAPWVEPLIKQFLQ
jgi:mutator protein MutT